MEIQCRPPTLSSKTNGKTRPHLTIQCRQSKRKKPNGNSASRPLRPRLRRPRVTLKLYDITCDSQLSLASFFLCWLPNRESRCRSRLMLRHELGGPGLLLSGLFFAPASEIKNLKIRKSKNGASEMISVTQHNSGTNHRKGM